MTNFVAHCCLSQRRQRTTKLVIFLFSTGGAMKTDCSFQDVLLASYTARLMRAAQHHVDWFPGSVLPPEPRVEHLAHLAIEAEVPSEDMVRVFEDFGTEFVLDHLIEIGELGLMTQRSVQAYHSLVKGLDRCRIESHMKKYVATLREQKAELNAFRGINGACVHFELLPDVIMSPRVVHAMTLCK